MNPQFGPPPTSQYSNPGLPPHNAPSYNSVQSQNVYNGLDTNSNPGFIQQAAGKQFGPSTYGQPPIFNQNGPQMHVQPSSNVGTSTSTQFNQKLPSRSGSNILTDQLSQQISNMSLSPSLIVPPQTYSPVASPAGNDFGQMPRQPPVSSAYPPMSGPPASMYGPPGPVLQSTYSPGSFSGINQNQHMEPPAPPTSQFLGSPYGPIPNSISPLVNTVQPHSSANTMQSNAGNTSAVFNQRPPPVPYSGISNISKSSASVSSAASATGPPPSSNIQNYPVSSLQSSGQYSSESTMSSMHARYPPVSSQAQQPLMPPPAEYRRMVPWCGGVLGNG